MTANIEKLRAELKEWEKAFAEANGGRKASREDIKNDPSIAAKYKAYARLRSQPSSSSLRANPDNGASPGHSQKKRINPFVDNDKHEHHVFATPRKVAKHTSSTPKHPSQLDSYETTSDIKKLLSPGGPYTSPAPLRTAIGPTPQRDGKVLGLFDLLSPSASSTATPSKRKPFEPADGTHTPSRARGMVTPSRRDGSALRPRRHSLTPASSAKKFFLSKYCATPTTMRFAPITEADDENDDKNADSERIDTLLSEQSPVRQRPEPETPTFLRRRNVLFAQPANHARSKTGAASPVAVRMPQRIFGRGLSQLVRDLHDLGEEMSNAEMEDDMEALREAEATERTNEDRGLVENSQIADSPSKVQRQWKKKGQKRTTRLVHLRPVRAKPQRVPEPVIRDEDSEDELDAVSEPQIPVSAGGDNGVGEDAVNSTRPKGKDSTQNKEKLGGNKLVQKARKIKATAHANYRALKIRSKNGAGKGRFGRRR
ncbi:predicted protein [Uncinocarpus reesii 1704]|uniref:DNA replication regulator SLD2 n=1 Tax=Uncinocarpus reesii (strain UAMH 1704) TaxID=336963 RepID=C4JX28_UNCRE|nr:uncharacterized protein UREG_06201 [Uncinocarpus reesii 1704]EEP81336.1 predicted protein [Uncinocarpus reesii 1704]